MKRIAVYCGSATPTDPIYLDAATMVGRTLASLGISIVYGGGRLGLMGAVADAAIEAGGEVIGIIPEALVALEVANPHCTKLEVVKGMHERKARFTELADGFLTLPGGVGTLDELWEAVSWAQLGYHAKPVGVLNIAGYYDHLIALYTHMARTGFVRPQHSDILTFDSELGRLLARMSGQEPPAAIFGMTADDL